MRYASLVIPPQFDSKSAGPSAFGTTVASVCLPCGGESHDVYRCAQECRKRDARFDDRRPAGYRAGENKLAWYRPDLSGPNGIQLQSDAFEDEGEIPFKYQRRRRQYFAAVVVVGYRASCAVADVGRGRPRCTDAAAVWFIGLLYNIPPRQTSLPENLIPEGFPASEQCCIAGEELESQTRLDRHGSA